MDYFQRFLGTTVLAQPKPPQDHQAEFHKSWSLVKNTLLHPDERQLTRGITSTDVPARLRSMVDALVWESTRIEEGTTGGCLEYLLKNDVLMTLVRLSEEDKPFGIQAEVLRSIANMVVLLDEQFLIHSAVHKAIIRLLRACAGDELQERVDGRTKVLGAASSTIKTPPSEYEEDLVDLLCVLCSRIRTYRELLLIFFHDKNWFQPDPVVFDAEETDDSDERPSSPNPSISTVTSAPHSTAPKKAEYEFLLFNYLLRYVHREGKIGDFARAGLLFLMDVAMSAGGEHLLLVETSTKPVGPDPIADAALALAEYVLDGDFSDVLGAGLGAVYSLLPSKLELRREISAEAGTASGMVLGANSVNLDVEQEPEIEKARLFGMEISTNTDFRSRLDHFLKVIEFLQDVLRRNIAPAASSNTGVLAPAALVGTAIAQSILDAVRTIFLENVLYPSILECSDTDGSAVAVMSYIDITLRTLSDGRLAELVIGYLMSEDDHDLKKAPPVTSKKSPAEEKAKKQNRRKSSAMVLLELEAPKQRGHSSYFSSLGRFTLKDLIFSSIRSKSQSTATAAFQLLQSLLRFHPRLTVDRLLTVTGLPEPPQTAMPVTARFPPPPLPRPDSPQSDEEAFVYPGLSEETALVDPFDAIPLFRQPDTTYATHEREVGLYLSLISRVDPSHDEEAFSTGYDKYLRDALDAIQDQDWFHDSGDGDEAPKYRLDPNDTVLSLALQSLRLFFAHTPEYNIALTGILATIAACPQRSLAGWLTFASTNTSESAISHPSQFDFSTLEGDDGDDRSVDFDVHERLSSGNNTLPASSINDPDSRPVIHTILQGLVSQLDRYRQIVDDFDQYLIERRQGLLFAENLNDALNLALELNDKSAPAKLATSPTTPTPASPMHKPKNRSKTSFVSFLTPKKSSSTSKPAVPSTPPSHTPAKEKAVAASPFGPHYKQTSNIHVQPFTAPPPISGPWSPPTLPQGDTIEEEEDVFTSVVRKRADSTAVKVTLSQLLDNVVILEESIKELTAIIQARRSLGIDQVRYL